MEALELSSTYRIHILSDGGTGDSSAGDYVRVARGYERDGKARGAVKEVQMFLFSGMTAREWVELIACVALLAVFAFLGMMAAWSIYLGV